MGHEPAMFLTSHFLNILAYYHAAVAGVVQKSLFCVTLTWQMILCVTLCMFVLDLNLWNEKSFATRRFQPLLAVIKRQSLKHVSRKEHPCMEQKILAV